MGIVRDLSILAESENDIVFNEDIEIEITDFDNAPDPNIKIQTKGNLTFKKSVNLIGGTMRLEGSQGIDFLGPKS